MTKLAYRVTIGKVRKAVAQPSLNACLGYLQDEAMPLVEVGCATIERKYGDEPWKYVGEIDLDGIRESND